MISIIIKVIGASLRAASRCPVRQRKRAVYAVTDRECNTAAYLATESRFPAFPRTKNIRLAIRQYMMPVVHGCGVYSGWTSFE